MINDSGNKVVAILRRTIVEVSNSQSSKLATGWLEFDRKRILDELALAKAEIEASSPADFPESHPELAADLETDEKVEPKE